jgi:preprotein translocase subunit SecA
LIELTRDYRNMHLKIPEKILQGSDSYFHEIIGKIKRRYSIASSFYKQAEYINEKANELKHYSEKQIKECLTTASQAFRRNRITEKTLCESLAAIAEAADRTLGLRPYIVQIMGALAINKGYLIEMATGEGKSLVGCMAGVLAGWTGRPCHIVTVNDYLSARDAEKLNPFYNFCGVSVSCVTGQMSPDERKINYAKNIVYTTSKELTADFLRDRIKMGNVLNSSQHLIRKLSKQNSTHSESLIMRGVDTAIIDEADSVLIDEAVTPLIISKPRDNKQLKDACLTANLIASSLEQGKDYTVDKKYKNININDDTLMRIQEQLNGFSGIWQNPERCYEILKQALTARHFFKKNEQYIIKEGKIVIIDELTGRAMPKRSWRQGLHQTIEAKEGVELSDPSYTLARISFQQFFRLFGKLSGMTGTAREAVSEFWQSYKFPVINIPPNKTCIRKQYPDSCFPDSDKKWAAIFEEIIQENKKERPVLVGTLSVKSSEKLALMLSQKDLRYNLLNAVHHEKEAQIIASAGEKNSITIATNMAGRGTDIKLGKGAKELGGLHVIASEKQKAGRVDRQLFGRCARQGDPGSCHAFMSIDDELAMRYINPKLRQILKHCLKNKFPGHKYFVSKTFSRAQKTSEKLAEKQRRKILQTDTWLKDSLSFVGKGLSF